MVKESRGKKVNQSAKATFPVKRDLLITVLEKARENIEALKYVTLFISFCLAFYLVYYSLTVTGSIVLVHLRNLTASILGAIFSVGGANVVVHGAMVSVNGFGLEIIDECTAVFSSIVYCSAVLAYPTTLKN